MANESRSESVEMYLKSVAELGGDRAPVPIGRVAERLGISPVSANEMMKRLGEQGLIEHKPYKGVTLTQQGRKIAASVIRKQRLWECFLVDHLGLDWAAVHELSCELEHATAPEVADALSGFLGHPTRCPHGNPIPYAGVEDQPGVDVPLTEIAPGQTAEIQAIVPESGEVLAYLARKGLLPGKTITVIEAAPLQGPLTILVHSSSESESAREIALGLNLAQLVLVETV